MSERFKSVEQMLVRKMFEKENTSVSPMSVRFVLYMAALASKGKTKEEILTFLNEDESHLLSDYRFLLDISDLLDNTLKIHNHVFYDKTLTLINKLQYSITESFDSTNEASRERIKDIIEKETNGLIDDFEINPNSLLLLLNIIYFKDIWEADLNITETLENENFTCIDGQVNKVPYITGKMTGCYEDEGEKYISLCYEQGACLTIYQPTDMFILKDTLLEDCDYIETIIDNSRERTSKESSFKMPKFEIKSKINFNKDLQEAVPSILSKDIADLSNLVKEKVCLDDIIQEVCIKIDEKGAEAAAATMSTFSKSVRIEDEPKHIIIDKPFMYIIHYMEQILFCGIVGKLQ